MAFTKENADTIIAQLGGNKFRAMTGAKSFMFNAAEKSLSMRIGRNSKSVNYVKITLTAMDLYNVEYGRIHGMKYTVKSTDTELYNDMLCASFERNTGMATSL
jgi:hypothetical protein